MDVISFVGNVIAGVVASFMTYFLMYLSRRQKLKSRFAKLSGRYNHLAVSGEPLADGITEIEYLSGNVIKTRGESAEGKWEGRITMNEDLPEFGSGIYQYVDRSDCGIHQIQVSPSKDMFYVLTTNTSHGKNRTVAYVWKR